MKRIFEDLGYDTQIDVEQNHLNEIYKVLLQLFTNWSKDIEKRNATLSEEEQIAQCILRMVILKTKTILMMSKGLPIKESRFVDIPSMYSVLRSLYELTFIFHNIYAEQETQIEKEIVLNIWKIRGLNNQQGHTFLAQKYKDKIEKGKKDIEELRTRTLALSKDLNLSDEITTQLTNVIKSNETCIKGYKFIREGSSIVKFEGARFCDVEKLFGKKKILLYELLSIHGHPSYLGVLQFGQMYDSEDEKIFLDLILKLTSIFASQIAVDFRDHIHGGIIAYAKAVNQTGKS